MKQKLLSAIATLFSIALFAQAPVIAGDTMLCPGGSGTASVTNGVEYDSYVWMQRDMGSSMPFMPISGETGPTFTYTADEYALKEIRLAALLGDVGLQSNILLIDALMFLPIYTITEESPDVSINPEDGSLLLCTGGTFNLSVAQNYNTNVQWFRNGVVIAESQMTLAITTPGEYWVSAAPSECPDYLQTSLVTLVADDPNCELSLPTNAANMFGLYPNPVKDRLHYNLRNHSGNMVVSTMTGQNVMSQKVQGEGNIDLSSLASGVYVLSLTTDSGSQNVRLIKQ